MPRGIPNRVEAREELRLPPRDPNRVRVRKHSQDFDAFHIDPDTIPEGQDWNWKRASTYGQEDRANITRSYDQGWEPVDGALLGRAPGPVENDGMLLMERPIELTEEARAAELAKAQAQIGGQKQNFKQAMADANPRNHSKLQPRIQTSVESFEVAE